MPDENEGKGAAAQRQTPPQHKQGKERAVALYQLYAACFLDVLSLAVLLPALPKLYQEYGLNLTQQGASVIPAAKQGQGAGTKAEQRLWFPCVSVCE